MSDEAAIVPAEAAPIVRRGPGRPSIYTPELAQTILDRYAAGEPIKRICADDGMPDHATYRKWKHTLPDFSAALAHARQDRAEVLVDRQGEHLAAVDPDSPFGSARVALARERVAYDRWQAERLDRENWGERPQVAIAIGSVQLAFARLSSPSTSDDE